MKPQSTFNHTQNHGAELDIQVGEYSIRLPKPDAQTYANILYALTGAGIALAAVYVTAKALGNFK